MRTDSSPFFRKAVIPWYDRNPAIAVMVVVLDAVAVFAAWGIRVAYGESGWAGHVWVPMLLLALCLVAMFTAIRRWVARRPSDPLR